VIKSRIQIHSRDKLKVQLLSDEIHLCLFLFFWHLFSEGQLFSLIEDEHESCSKQENDQSPGESVRPSKSEMIAVVLLEEFDGIKDAGDDDRQHSDEKTVDAGTVGAKLASFNSRAKADGDGDEGGESDDDGENHQNLTCQQPGRNAVVEFADEGFGAGLLPLRFGENGGDLALLEEAVSRVRELAALQSPRRRSRRRDEEEEGHQAEQTCQHLNASGDDDGLHLWFHRRAHDDFLTMNVIRLNDENNKIHTMVLLF